VNTADWLMLAVGAGLVLVGLLITARSRRPVQVEQARLDNEEPPEPRFAIDRFIDRHQISTQTVIAAGMSLIVIGYHFVAWALPAGFKPLHIEPGLGWLLPLVATGLVMLSRALDVMEQG
jgi:hypothetical protein